MRRNSISSDIWLLVTHHQYIDISRYVDISPVSSDVWLPVPHYLASSHDFSPGSSILISAPGSKQSLILDH